MPKLFRVTYQGATQANLFPVVAFVVRATSYIHSCNFGVRVTIAELIPLEPPNERQNANRCLSGDGSSLREAHCFSCGSASQDIIA